MVGELCSEVLYGVVVVESVEEHVMFFLSVIVGVHIYLVDEFVDDIFVGVMVNL